MTGTQLAALIRYKTRTNSTTFTDADMLVLVNIFKDEIAAEIVKKDAGYFLLPTTFDLVADQREYTFSDTMLNRMQKLELKFSASDARFPSKYIKDYQGSETESEIVKSFGNSEGEFAHYIRRRSLLILSGTISAVTAGGRLWSYTFPADLANLTGSTALETDPTTTTFGFPRLFQELLARRVSIEYKGRQPKPIPLSPMERNYGIDLTTQLDGLTPQDNSGEVIGELPDSSEIGNDGWNY